MNDLVMDKIYFDDAIIEINGKKFFITHGDGLLSWDYGYKVLKRVIRSKFFIWLLRWIHPTITYKFARYISKSGRHNTHLKNLMKMFALSFRIFQKNILRMALIT
tara:strand:+ start:519 stop:833 length:315 start_codon:yes stop_codon:yes gene_type:complete